MSEVPEMIIIKTSEEVEKMRAAGRLVAACHQELSRMIRSGMTTSEIDLFVEAYLTKHGASAEQKGYHGYRFATCASVNDEVCHGFPRKKALKAGDIVTIDFVANLDGWLADSAWSYQVGPVSAEAEDLLRVTHAALFAGIEQAIVGNRIGDIGHAIQTFVEPKGYSVVRDFTGHGIGREMHEDPQVPHFGSRGRGPLLKPGMVITIEPMINAGAFETVIDPNGWTARTADGELSAQYEHTIAITESGPIVLTQL